jgi:hypothetical protein
MSRFLSRSAVLFVLLLGAARADWTEIAPANEIYSAYADVASIRSGGPTTTMIGLYDFRRKDFTPEGLALLSTVVLREYDCGRRRVRLLHAVDFSDHMGAGEAVLISARPGRWEDVVEAGIDDAFLRVACAPR